MIVLYLLFIVRFVGEQPQEFYRVFMPRKTNMSPENRWLEDVFPISHLFRGHVSFRGVYVSVY